MPEEPKAAQPQEPEASSEVEGRLLLAQRTDREINEAVLQPMFRTGPRFWALVAGLGAVFLWGMYAWGYLVQWGVGTTGKNRPVYWTLFITTFVFW
ncbi:MAG TPA: hypothetical protein VFI11_09860, partial [Anaerolineales bacterium]|nr:hypothetical protein [Anaerolineales bacterium]